MKKGKEERGREEKEREREREREDRIQVAFAHLRNLLTPLAAKAVYFSHDVHSVSRG